MSESTHPDQAAARDLLFGLLAFQHGFIDREALLGAFSAWMADKSHSLPELLRERGALDGPRYELIAVLVPEHLRRHRGDAGASLTALSSVDSVRHELAQTADPALLATLTLVATSHAAADATPTFAPAFGQRRTGERFRILRFHRKGGLGQIHVARDLELGRDVALKEILPEKADSDELRSRFLLEAEINGGLEHPGIVPVYSLGTYADGKPYYAMRFVEGDSFKEAIEVYHEAHPGIEPGSVDFRKLLTRFIDVCETIAYAHSRGVLHRDLKPSNIMLGRYGEVLIIDWGLAKATGRRSDSGAGTPEAALVPASGDSRLPTIGILGSPPYMSPEQARGEVDALGPATDIYGLGATLYHLLTGRPPIDADSSETIESILDKVRRGAIKPPRSQKAGIPPALEAIAMKALAVRPEDRFHSAQVLAADVEHYLADELVSAYREPWLDRARRRSRRHRTLVTSVAAVLVFGLTALAGFSTLLAGKNRELDAKNVALADKNRELDAKNVALADKNQALARQTQRAESRERMAIDAVKHFRDIVVEEPVLKNSPALGELRKKLLKEPLAFFRSFREQLQADNETNPDALARLANAGHDYAHLAEEIGDIHDGLRSQVESLSIWEKLVRDHPATAEYENGLALVEYCRGKMLSKTGDTGAARWRRTASAGDPRPARTREAQRHRAPARSGQKPQQHRGPPE